MKITRDNYESWFLDFLEGNLDEAGMEMVRQFLSRHPDLAEELSALPPSLEANLHLSYSAKDQLKRSVLEEPELFEEQAIAYLEGDLNPAMQEELIHWMQDHPVQQEFFQRLEACKLHPDLALNFPGRESLKKKSLVLPVWSRIAIAAAMVVLALLAIRPTPEQNGNHASLSAATDLPPSKVRPSQSKVATETSALALLPATKNPVSVRQTVTASKMKPSLIEPVKPIDPREHPQLALLEPREARVGTSEPAFADLVPLQGINSDQIKPSGNGDITLAEYYGNRLQSLKANSPNEFITREEVTFAGLRLFSKLPGRHLTARKGGDGKLKSINFNTQLLAFSIPVHSEL